MSKFCNQGLDRTGGYRSLFWRCSLFIFLTDIFDPTVAMNGQSIGRTAAITVRPFHADYYGFEVIVRQ